MLCIYLALAAATWAAFSSVRTFAFVDFDDDKYVFEPHVKDGLSWRNVTWDFGVHGPSQWHPLAWLSHQADCALFGVDRPGLHHLTSLLLHIGSVLLLFEFLRRATGETWPSGLAAALFALHPLSVESVAWVSERRDVLSGLFCMLTLLAYLGYARRGGVGRYLLVAGSLALGLMSKPMLVTLPCVLLLLDYWPLRRPGSWRRRVLEKLPLLALSAVSSVLTVLCQRDMGAISPLDKYPLEARLGNAVLAYGMYLGKMIWPSDLAMSYAYSTSPDFAIVLGVGVALALITVAAVVLRRHTPAVLVGWLWYLGTLVPVLGLVQVGTPVFADRYTYLPLVGIYLAIAFGARELVRNYEGAKHPLAIVAALWLVCLLARTREQAGYWHDSEQLYAHAVEVSPESADLQSSFGNYLQRNGRIAEALPHFEKVVQLRSGDAEAHNALGSILLSAGRTPAAISQFKQALKLRGDDAEAYKNLGIALAAAGRNDEAIKAYQQALHLRGNYPEARYNYGRLLLSVGLVNQAIAQYEKALKLKEDYVEAHFDLAIALAQAHRPLDAVGHFERALALKSDFAEAHNSLAGLLLTMGREREAIGHYEQALQLWSENSGSEHADAEYYLSVALERVGRAKEAKEHFDRAIDSYKHLAWLLATRGPADGGAPPGAVAMAERASELTRNRDPEVLDALSAAYASAGRFPEAIFIAETAARIARQSGRRKLAEDIGERETLYKKGRPYRLTPGEPFPGSRPAQHDAEKTRHVAPRVGQTKGG